MKVELLKKCREYNNVYYNKSNKLYTTSYSMPAGFGYVYSDFKYFYDLELALDDYRKNVVWCAREIVGYKESIKIK